MVLVSFLTQTLRRQTLVLLVSVRVDVKSIIKTRQFWCVIIAAYLFSLSWILPFCLNGTSIAKCLLLAIPGGGLFALLLSLSLLVCRLVRERIPFYKESDFAGHLHRFFDKIGCKVEGKGLFLWVFLTLLAIWGLVFLVCYPACCSTDTNDIFKMVLGLPFESNHFRYDSLNNHHPAFYVFINYVLLSLGQAMGLTLTMSVALIALIHLVVLAICCSYFAIKLRELFASEVVFVFAWVFFALNPVIAQYSVTIWKDVLFSGVFLVFVIQYAFLVIRSAEFISDKKRIIVFYLIALCCSLLRNNAFAAILIAIAFLLCIKQIRKIALILFASILVSFCFASGPIYSLVGIQPTHFAESMSVPLQQVGRVVAEKGVVTDEQWQFLNEIMPYEQWSEKYNPASPNSIKFASDFDDTFLEKNKIDFIVCWTQIGLQNPGIYFRAWCAQTLPFWSMTGTTWHVVPPGYIIDSTQGLVAHNLVGDIVSYDDFSLYREAHIAAFEPLYNVAGLVWLAIFSFMVVFCGNKPKRALMYLPLGLLWMTFLVAAPASDYRYLFAFLLLVPFFVSVCFFNVAIPESSKCMRYNTRSG